MDPKHWFGYISHLSSGVGERRKGVEDIFYSLSMGDRVHLCHVYTTRNMIKHQILFLGPSSRKSSGDAGQDPGALPAIRSQGLSKPLHTTLSQEMGRPLQTTLPQELGRPLHVLLPQEAPKPPPKHLPLSRFATPTASGRATPIASGRATPIASGRATPIASGRATPIASGRATPIASGRATPTTGGRATPTNSYPGPPYGTSPCAAPRGRHNFLRPLCEGTL
jgi:hypothetical protein